MRRRLWFGALAFAGSLLCIQGIKAAPPKIPVANFAALPVLSKPVLSPDGRWIAARSTAFGRTKLVVIDADKPDVVRQTINFGERGLALVTWAGNDRLLLTVQSTDTLWNGRELPFYRLLVIDVSSGAVRVVDRKSRGAFAGDVLYADPTGSWALVSSQDDTGVWPSVKRVDLTTGIASLVEKWRTGVWSWYADDDGVVRAGIAREGRQWTLWYRDKPGEKLRQVRAKLATDDSSVVDKFIFRGANSWIVTNERNGRFGLYKFDVNTGAVGDAIFEHPEVDIDEVRYDNATGEVKAITYQDDRYHTKWLEPDMNKLQARLDEALPGSSNLSVDWSTDEKRVLVYSSGGANPGRYYLLDRATSKMHAVVDPYPLIDPALLAEVRTVRYAARDGLSIPGYLTLPKGREAKDLPLIVFPHGGPFYRDSWSYNPIVQFLASRGYAVLQPEFRGSTGYGKSFVSKGYGEWGKRMQDDLDDGVDWLARTGQVDPKRVCIVGASYGGYAAMWGAIRNPERYRCAASWAGVSDLAEAIRHERQAFSAPRYFRDWRTKVAGDGDFDAAAVSPLKFADKLKIPIFIAHGEKDTRVLPKQSHDMVAALAEERANVTSAFYKDSTHDFDSSADLEDWMKRLEIFLAKYNPA